MLPPMFRTTTVFLFLALNAAETCWIVRRSPSVSLKSPSVFVRSRPSPAFLPMVITATSDSSAMLVTRSFGMSISAIGTYLNNPRPGVAGRPAFTSFR